MNSRHIDLLIILTGYLIADNKFQREVTVFTHNNSNNTNNNIDHNKLFNDVTAFLLTTDLQAEPQYTDKAQQLSVGGHRIVFYKQHNPGASRKQVQPWLDAYFAQNY